MFLFATKNELQPLKYRLERLYVQISNKRKGLRVFKNLCWSSYLLFSGSRATMTNVASRTGAKAPSWNWRRLLTQLVTVYIKYNIWNTWITEAASSKEIIPFNQHLSEQTEHYHLYWGGFAAGLGLGQFELSTWDMCILASMEVFPTHDTWPVNLMSQSG